MSPDVYLRAHAWPGARPQAVVASAAYLAVKLDVHVCVEVDGCDMIIDCNDPDVEAAFASWEQRRQIGRTAEQGPVK